MFDKILPDLLAGVSVGGQYALIAVGYTMVYGILRLINFAHGDIFTAAGFFMVYLVAAMPLAVSVPLVIILTVALAALEAAGSVDPADVAAALPSVTYNGITGSIAFDENGDAKKDMAYIKKADGDAGAFVFEKTQSVAELEK